MCPDPTRPWYVRVLDSTGSSSSSINSIPGHPWDEKGLQTRKGVGLLVGIQERRAIFRPGDKPVVNLGSTAGEPLILSLHRFTKEFLCSFLHWDVQRHTKHAGASVYLSASSPHPGMKSASRPAGKRPLHVQGRRP